VSALLGSLFAAWWPQIVGGLAAVAGLAGVYLKGRSTERRKSEIKDLTDANQIRKDGAAARERAASDGLRDDGFRRD
jgi:hypothetical protein